MIPKIIHYCWLSNNPFPEKIQKCMDSWKKLEGYEFILWNFERFDINSSLWVKGAFEAKKYAFAADYIRLYAVYHYGGIYLDSDIEIVKPFDDLLNAEYMFAYEDNETKAIEMACFGAVKGSPLIAKVLDYYKDRHFVSPDGSLNVLPITWITRDIFAQSSLLNDLLIHTDDYFTVTCHKTGVIKVSKNTYAIHHFSMSWCSDLYRDGVIRRRKIINLFGDNIFSTMIAYCLGFCTRIKRIGLKSSLSYYTDKYIKGKPIKF